MKHPRIPLTDLKSNPDNPRFIRDEKFKKLVKSIQEFPEMLETRPVIVNKDLVILGGNMRYRAAIELGYTDIPALVVDWTEQQQKEFLIKDNVSFGEWDWDVLANEWEAPDLAEWGMDIWNPAEVYTPSVTPTFAGKEITDADVQRAAANQDIVQINTKHDVTCPSCGHAFHIDR